MGILNIFSRPSPKVQVLPSGSMTIDRNGAILASTVASAYSSDLLREVGNQVLRLFRESRRAQMPLSELILQFGSLQITAREMRGGAMIFLTPKHAFNISN